MSDDAADGLIGLGVLENVCIAVGILVLTHSGADIRLL